MALKVAVQMDPIEGINIDADSTFALMLEAQARGHALWHYEVRHMSLREGMVPRRTAGGASVAACPAADHPARAGRALDFGEASRSTSARWTWC